MANSIHSQQIRYDVALLLLYQLDQHSVGQPCRLSIALFERAIELNFIDSLAEPFLKMRIAFVDGF